MTSVPFLRRDGTSVRRGHLVGITLGNWTDKVLPQRGVIFRENRLGTANE